MATRHRSAAKETRKPKDHAERHHNKQTEIDEIVVFGKAEAQHIADVHACKYEQYMLYGDEEGDGQPTGEADGGFQGAAPDGDHNRHREGKGKDDIFQY